ncbi:MAG: hypothetical protein Q9227_002794 [Pyrenula ochraceoflavens]
MVNSSGTTFLLPRLRQCLFHPRIYDYNTFKTSRTFRDFRKVTTLKSDLGLETDDSQMPPYPYGPSHHYPLADQGLFGGNRPQTGNKISKGRNKGKTKRKWQPNIKIETLRSDALERDFLLRVTASCKRTIMKCGGLDQYLLGDKPARIKELGLLGWKLRWKVMNSQTMREKYSAERDNLGLPPRTNPYETFEEAMDRPDFQEELRKEQQEAWEALREKDIRFRTHARRQWLVRRSMPLGSGRVIKREQTPGRDTLLDPLAPLPEYGSALG